MIAVEQRQEVTRERRRQEKERRIESIIESAKQVFFSKGYLGATMDEIALGARISKPTIYHYFKTKDDLFFSLMKPVVEDIGKQLEKIEQRLDAQKYSGGEDLLRDYFRAFYHSYELSPDAFRIVQLFQQTGFVAQFDPEIRETLNNKGRHNFELGRKILRKAIKEGLIKRVGPYSLADLMWGLTVGVIQLEDIKGDDKQRHTYKKAALKLAEQIFVDTLSR